MTTLKEQALAQLAELHQRQVVEALGEVQGLGEDHPIWATVAMLGAVIGRANADIEDTAAEVAGLRGDLASLRAELAKLSRQVVPVLEDAARLSRRMPGFLERLEEVLGGMRREVGEIRAEVARLAVISPAQGPEVGQSSDFRRRGGTGSLDGT